MANFLIGGMICGDSSEAMAYEDVSPAQVRAFFKGLTDKEDVEIEITSPGGSCVGGFAIANLIKDAQAAGHKVTAHVIGLAASMASVIACACDEIVMDESALMMIHNPWSMAEGDADELRKQADVLDTIKAGVISIYQSKFDKTRDELCAMMDAETWFTGATADTVGLRCTVRANGEPIRAAACAKIPGFMHAPDALKGFLKLNEEKKMEEVKIEEAAPVAEAKAEAPAPEMITKAEAVAMAEKRVSGMQSAMQAQINEFKNQLAIREKELTDAQAKVTRLEEQMAKVSSELQETASALATKSDALAKLNARVNAPAEELPTLAEGLAKCTTPAERSAFIASGKYKKN